MNNIEIQDSNLINTNKEFETNDELLNNNNNTNNNNNLSSSSSSTSFLKNLVNTGTNLLFSSSSSISSPPGLVSTTTTTTSSSITTSSNNLINNDVSKQLSFSNDMSEGFDTLSKRSEIGIEQCKELLDYFKQRASIEEKYSKNIINYFPKFKVVNDNDSFQKGVSILNKISDSESNIHKMFSQNLLNNLCHPFATLIKDMEQKRKTLVSNGQKLKNEYKESIENLKKSNLKYEKVLKEMELAKLELIEREPDANSIKVQSLERKLAKCESNSILAEEEYKNQIKETNDFIAGTYQTRLTDNLNEFEQFESMRLQFMKSNIKNYIGLMMEMPLNLECEINAANQLVDLIDPDNDLQCFIKQNTTCKKVIQPFTFDPFSNEQPLQSQSSSSLNYASPLTVSNIENNNNNNNTNNTTNEVQQLQPISSTTTVPSNDNVENINTPSSPPVQPTQPPKQTLKENIFGFFNKATTNLKSSTSNLLKDDNSNNNNINSNNNNSQLSKSSNIIGIPINNSNSVFGIELEVLMENNNNNNNTDNKVELEVPLILTQFVSTLLKMGSFEKDGIFITLPSNFNIQQEKQRLDQGGNLESITDVYLVATLFKHWIGDLPNPLISYAIYDEIIESPQNAWKIIESGIPILHRKVLHYIIDFLVEFVQASKMDTHSISIIFAPVLIRSPGNNDALMNSKKEIAVIENMIIDSIDKKKTNKFVLKRNLPIIPTGDGDNGDIEDEKNIQGNEDGDDEDDEEESDGGHIDDCNNSSTSGDGDNNSSTRGNFDNLSGTLGGSNGSGNGSTNDNSTISSNNNNSNNNSITHHFLYQTTPTSNVTPVLSSASDFFDECINNSSTTSTSSKVPNSGNLPPRNSSNLSFDTTSFSTNQSDSEPVLVESYDNDDFDILSYK